MLYLRSFTPVVFSLLNYPSFIPNCSSTIHLHVTLCSVRRHRAGLQPTCASDRDTADCQQRIREGMGGKANGFSSHDNSSWVHLSITLNPAMSQVNVKPEHRTP